MINSRIIPVLLLTGEALVKTIKFRDRIYIGDPLNAIKIFNEKEVDELIILDIDAHKRKMDPDFSYIKRLATECFMPVCYGGGIVSLDSIKELFFLGIEKVSINSASFQNINLISEAAKIYGVQSIIGAMDVKKNLFGKYDVFYNNGRTKGSSNPFQWVKTLENAGAGEIFLNSIDNDGLMCGFDISLIKRITEIVKIPVIACGGAGNIDHCKTAIDAGGAAAVGVGSMCVFKDKNRAVLISYPNHDQLKNFRDE
jgi:cyclase